MTDDPQNDSRDSGEDGSEEDGRSRKGSKPPKAKDELFEAIDHFKRAANIFFDKATSDPTVKNATDEAERVIRKLGDTAEPLAKQLTSELGKLTKKISDSLAETVEATRKKSPSKAPDARVDPDDQPDERTDDEES